MQALNIKQIDIKNIFRGVSGVSQQVSGGSRSRRDTGEEKQNADADSSGISGGLRFL